jgi:hypothetical protein
LSWPCFVMQERLLYAALKLLYVWCVEDRAA